MSFYKKLQSNITKYIDLYDSCSDLLSTACRTLRIVKEQESLLSSICLEDGTILNRSKYTKTYEVIGKSAMRVELIIFSLSQKFSDISSIVNEIKRSVRNYFVSLNNPKEEILLSSPQPSQSSLTSPTFSSAISVNPISPVMPSSLSDMIDQLSITPDSHKSPKKSGKKKKGKKGKHALKQSQSIIETRDKKTMEGRRMDISSPSLTKPDILEFDSIDSIYFKAAVNVSSQCLYATATIESIIKNLSLTCSMSQLSEMEHSVESLEELSLNYAICDDIDFIMCK
ncbi:hypothetical protein ADUPG1_013881 [Aduncisulcus paluster]|uniref:Uncharacterized protein n=1 Tax=Aduncisulcus paluster TaxID=2918883 RepID=A0ABQ5K4M1_9EUKA|nr:hypothetical protein ADUPG1_013881 [Aduncisulcus paluster]